MTAPAGTAADPAAPGGLRSVFAPAYLPITFSTLTLVALAAFDGMAVAAALPKIGADLGVELLPWVLTAFLLTSTVAMLAAGPVIDTLGVGRAYRFTLVEFLAASALCTVAPNLPVLIAARVLQGVGGGLVMATSLAIVGLSYPPELRSRAFAANSTVWGVMALAGPAVAAFMVSVVSWRGIFAINVPLVALAAAIGWRRLPTAERGGRLAFDWRGLAIVAAFVTVTLVGIAELKWWSALCVAAGAALLAVYWRHTAAVAQPVLARRHFAAAPFGLLNAIPFTFFAGSLAIDAYIPLYVQGGLGHSSSVAAFAVAYLALGWTSGSQIVSRLLDRIANTTAIVGGFVLTLPALAAGVALYSDHTPVGVVFALSYVQGVGIGSVTNATLSLLQRLAGADEMGRASAAHQFLRNLGGTLGTAAAGAVLFAVVAARVGSVEPVRRLLGGKDVELAGDTRAAIATGFRAAALVALVLTTVGLVIALHTQRRLRETSGHAPARLPG